MREYSERLTPGQGSSTAIDRLAELRQIALELIDTPRRPARRFLGDIAALAESMQDVGLQQPVSVRVAGDRFVLTSGMRRLSAARMLRWTSIPAFVRNVSADDAYVVDLIENMQRQDLTAEEEADALGELIRTRGWTLQQVADAIKRSVAYISKRVRLFEDPLLRDAVVDRGMPVSTAEELLGAPIEQRPRLIQQALAERWDQVRARDALRSLESAQSEADQHTAPAPPAPDDSDELFGADDRDFGVHAAGADAADRPQRPRGLTRAIREFHGLLSEIRPEDLTHSDRAALRALFRDLLLLARASTTRKPPVFPPLPVSGSKGSKSQAKTG